MKNILISLLALLIMCLGSNSHGQPASQKPIRLAIIGMTHGHIAFILGRKDKKDFQLVGVYEPNRELALKLASQYGFDTGLIYSKLEAMLDKVKPEAAVAFGSVYEHMAAVEACAPRGIHVMVEKPLATHVAHAQRMNELARKHHIHLLTDFETSWYPTTAKSFELVNDSNYVGAVKKVVVHDGHQGPKEIGCDQYFLEWLTDPIQNGGGALIDFGCYGANLMTYLMKGEEPTSVTAVTRQFKPEIYPKVDDEATIIVTYPTAQCIIQASWNWPFGRKDMEIYGVSGSVIAENSTSMRLRQGTMQQEQHRKVTAKDIAVYEDPFIYFGEVIRGKVKMSNYDPYSLPNNVTVVKILDAARESAKTGKTVQLK
ncbi:MAG TPA: Gfo/Idh/MocA family oxidoreductase [Prolixibacteraceae bacterium]|nr:Gfo/Idh/MocA family oxidoreductase [Prolixibacteraceae bacterium]